MFLGMKLDEICDVIILVSAVIIAWKNIYGFFKAPVVDLQEKARVAEEEHIQEVLEKKLPSIVEKNHESIIDSLEEVKEIVLDQQKDLDNISKSIKDVNKSQVDLMKYHFSKLYYKYRPYKKMLSSDKKAFMELYEDYHKLGGNTWVTSLYDEVKNWEAVEDESQLET